ncbi:hypothetical protein B0H34DRAFT_809599 [Crassisporium funariophilum]|nr:hypothetical protein B0H34DRAFT_809599 [Crassisporium funariophilum]
MASSVYLVYDLIAQVMELCRHNSTYFFNFSLTCGESILIGGTRVLFLSECSNFLSASLVRNAPYVLALEIRGSRSPPRNALSVKLLEAIKAFVNIGSVKIITPLSMNQASFLDCLPAMRDLRCLTEVVVKESCATDAKAISGLRKLTLLNPGRAILDLLPDFGKTIKYSCGTPPKGHEHSTSFPLERKSIDCLEPEQQMKHPHHQPKLENLRALTVTYPHLSSRHEVGDFCKWIRRAISGSPIEELWVIYDYCVPGPNLRFDSLIDHLVKKYSSTLHYLDLGSAFVGVVGLKILFTSCTRLEVLGFLVG